MDKTIRLTSNEINHIWEAILESEREWKFALNKVREGDKSYDINDCNQALTTIKSIKVKLSTA